jgi:Fe-S-cluster-containing hydrogenase component 2
MKHEDDIYRNLQEHIDAMPVAFPKSVSGLDIRLLKHLFTPEEARIALELSALPESIERIHKRFKNTGISIDNLEKILDRMVMKGAILGGSYYQKKGPNKHYSKAQFSIGMYELQAMNLTREFQSNFEEYGEEVFNKIFSTKKTSQLRTIPIRKGINHERYVGSYDDAREIINKTDEKIAVIRCICRHGQDLLGESCKHSEIRDTCILFEDIARFAIGSGQARVVSKEEVLEILDQAENSGFVLQPENNQKPHFICCCCGCCCHVLKTVKKFPRPVEYYHSNYYAKVDTDLCDMCWECMDKCALEALSMENDGTTVDLDRCIGCGVCAAACPAGAIALHAKGDPYVPPKDHDALYKKILRERVGTLGMLKMVPGIVLKRKI